MEAGCSSRTEPLEPDGGIRLEAADWNPWRFWPSLGYMGFISPTMAMNKRIAAAAYVQQRGGGDFADPIWPSCSAWRVPATVPGRHPPLAVEGVLQVAVLPPPSDSSAGLVCSCRRVWSATASALDAVPSRVATELSTSEPAIFVFRF